jgi:hypothetical protein
MANSITKRILYQETNSKRVVLQVTIKGDGSGEETNTVLFDPAVDASPVMPAAAGLTIDEICGNIQLFDILLAFKGTTNTPIFLINRAPGDSFLDFRQFGGIKDNTGAGATGQIIMTTTGLTAASTAGQATFIIAFRKD